MWSKKFKIEIPLGMNCRCSLVRTFLKSLFALKLVSCVIVIVTNNSWPGRLMGEEEEGVYFLKRGFVSHDGIYEGALTNSKSV